MWVLDLLLLLGPLIFLPVFSLSLAIAPDASLSLFLSAIPKGRAPPYTAATRRHLAKLNQQEHDKTQKKKRLTQEKTETHMLQH